MTNIHTDTYKKYFIGLVLVSFTAAGITTLLPSSFLTLWFGFLSFATALSALGVGIAIITDQV